MKNKLRDLELYPDHIQSKLNERTSMMQQSLPPYVNGMAVGLLIEDLKIWRVGTLRVSFKGGDSVLHDTIAKIAARWEIYGNIKFDFGYNPQNQKYRSWSPKGNEHIRIGFEYAGYWSLVGTDCIDSSIISNNAISLNLSGFDKALPNNFKGIILHEFGHALGFLHEHQGPVDCGFNMEEIYKDLQGPPNYWSKEQIDHNIRQVDLAGKRYSAHDKHSIMHYSFPSWMFKEKEHSPCFTKENIKLSDTDKAMMQEAYPFSDQLIRQKDMQRQESLNALLALSKLDDSLRETHLEHFNFYQQFNK